MTYVYPNISVEDTISGKGATALARIRVATTTAGTLATSFDDGSVIDGVTLATNDRILIKNQVSGVENGIYNVQASGAPIRAQDFDTGAPVGSTLLVIDEGTANSDTIWMCTNNFNNDIAGVDSLTFLQVAGSGVDGNVNGPSSATDNAVVRFDGATGKLLKNSGVFLSNTNSLTGLVDIGLSGDIIDSSGNKLIDLITTGSAVNSISISNAATGNNASIGASGEANRGITLLDSNSNEIAIFGSVVSAVNEITITNSTTGNAPNINASGSDTNVSLDFATKGTGVFNFQARATAAEVRLFDDNSSNYIGLRSPATISANFTLNLPTGVGSASTVLTTDGNNPAALTWANPLPFQTSASATGSTTTTSATNAVISGMTITPASGRYLVLFSANTQSVTNTSVTEISVFNNAVQNTTTIRTNTYPSGAFLHISTISLELVNGSQAIDVRWRRVSGTGTPTMTNRQLILIRVL